MYLSVFDIFKVGVGPSSSHTMGPMSAAADFVQLLSENAQDAHALEVRIYGSLALTGKGHATDRAIFLGLMGIRPDTIDADHAERLLSQLSCNKAILLPGGKRVRFRPDQDLIFEYDKLLPHHTNGMRFSAVYDQGGVVLEETYYSIGGGFVMTEAEMKRADAVESIEDVSNCPYPFETASEMLAMGDAAGLSIAEMKRANELSQQTPEVLSEGITRIWLVMDTCIERGLNQDGILPGGLHVRRRAKAIHEKLVAQKHANSTQPHAINDWISVYALAVNEENAAGGQVVTSPTNGAAGIVPATIRYYRDYCAGATEDGIEIFLLTAAAIGGLIKYNASISGAECGCQAEVGSASAMAAAGLCAALGGSNAQIENAAEIALEHHLGMTCDPVKGLVQVPCIERNGIGAIKAVSAASIALNGDGAHIISLDQCIDTMRRTGEDMSAKYKETSLGGLALSLPAC